MLKIKKLNETAVGIFTDSEGLCRTIPAGTHGSTPHLLKTIVEQENLQFRIRKLTPKECWRLMGFDDSDFERAEKVNSNTQLKHSTLQASWELYCGERA